jgi:hypothetical protein
MGETYVLQITHSWTEKHNTMSSKLLLNQQLTIVTNKSALAKLSPELCFRCCGSEEQDDSPSACKTSRGSIATPSGYCFLLRRFSSSALILICNSLVKYTVVFDLYRDGSMGFLCYLSLARASRDSQVHTEHRTPKQCGFIANGQLSDDGFYLYRTISRYLRNFINYLRDSDPKCEIL